jgi:hypothetical protein
VWTAAMVSSRRASTQMPSTVSTCFFAKARPEACWTASGGKLGAQSVGTVGGQFAFHHPQEMQLHNQPRFGLQAGTGTAGRPLHLQGRHPNSAQGPKLYHPPASAMLTWMFFRPILRSKWARFSDSSTCRHAQAAGGAAAVLW